MTPWASGRSDRGVPGNIVMTAGRANPTGNNFEGIYQRALGVHACQEEILAHTYNRCSSFTRRVNRIQ